MVLETKEGLPKLVLVSFPTRTRHWGRAGLDTCARHPGSLHSVRSPNGDPVSPEVVTARVNYYLPRPLLSSGTRPDQGEVKWEFLDGASSWGTDVAGPASLHCPPPCAPPLSTDRGRGARQPGCGMDAAQGSWEGSLGEGLVPWVVPGAPAPAPTAFLRGREVNSFLY